MAAVVPGARAAILAVPAGHCAGCGQGRGLSSPDLLRALVRGVLALRGGEWGGRGGYLTGVGWETQNCGPGLGWGWCVESVCLGCQEAQNCRGLVLGFQQEEQTWGIPGETFVCVHG